MKMLRQAVPLFVLLFGSSPLAAESREADRSPETAKERTSYSLGARFGSDLREAGYEIDLEQLVRGLEAAFSGSLQMSEEEIHASLEELAELRREQQSEAREHALAVARLEGQKFLTENAKRAGVVSLPSGLQYEVIKEGSGPSPSLDHRVTCHYRGTLLDGTPFDSTFESDRPLTFVVANVIAGWEEALQLMSVGSRWKLFIPPKLAYGETGFRDRIPPNATLLFEVELLAIEESSQTP